MRHGLTPIEPRVAELFNLGTEHLERGEYKDAAFCLTEALKVQKFPELYSNLGKTYHEAGYCKLAEACYRSALTLIPDDAQEHNAIRSEVYANITCSLMACGELADAEVAVTKALEVDSNNPTALGNMGNLLIAVGRSREAVPFFERSIAIEPNPGTHCNLIFAMDLSDDFSLADLHLARKRWAAVHADPLYPN